MSKTAREEITAACLAAGLDPNDKRARREIAKQRWRERHPDWRAQQVEWTMKSRNKNQERLERVRAYAKSYRVNNPKHKALKARAYRRMMSDDERRVRHQEYMRQWRAANRKKTRQYEKNREARERGAAGAFTQDQIDSLLKLQRNRCGYCRKSISGGYHVDHIVALSKGGSNDITNIQLLCGTCNRRKSAKHPLEFAKELGLLV